MSVRQFDRSFVWVCFAAHTSVAVGRAPAPFAIRLAQAILRAPGYHGILNSVVGSMDSIGLLRARAGCGALGSQHPRASPCLALRAHSQSVEALHAMQNKQQECSKRSSHACQVRVRLGTRALGHGHRQGAPGPGTTARRNVQGRAELRQQPCSAGLEGPWVQLPCARAGRTQQEGRAQGQCLSEARAKPRPWSPLAHPSECSMFLS